MNSSFTLLLVVLSFSTLAQTTSTSLKFGHVDSLYSTILGENREVWVYVPKEKSDEVYLPQRYPVVYLLDGDMHFSSVMGMIQQLSEVNSNMVVPKMILVGILNTNRTRDLTPTHFNFMPDDSASGGGERFTEFLEKELIPRIDSLYPTAPYRTFIGHSLGGLMVVNTLIHHPHLFNSYVAIDPSLWWDNQVVLRQANQVIGNKSLGNKNLFLAIANTIAPGQDTLTIRKDTTEYTMHIRSMLEFKDQLKAKAAKSEFQWSYKYYPEEDHGSVPLISEYDAFRFIFGRYRLNVGEQLFRNPNYPVDSALVAHFSQVSQFMNYPVLPPEPLVNFWGYNLLSRKNLSKARALFLLNAKNYPTSANAYDSLADYYLATGDKEKARLNFTKSLSIKELPGTREKLEKLMEEKAP